MVTHKRKVSIENYPKVRDKIIFREIGEEGFIFNPDTGSMKVLNLIATFIWKLYNGKHSLEEIVKKIQKEFQGGAQNKVRKDLQFFLGVLKRDGFII